MTTQEKPVTWKILFLFDIYDGTMPACEIVFPESDNVYVSSLSSDDLEKEVYKELVERGHIDETEENSEDCFLMKKYRKSFQRARMEENLFALISELKCLMVYMMCERKKYNTTAKKAREAEREARMNSVLSPELRAKLDEAETRLENQLGGKI